MLGAPRGDERPGTAPEHGEERNRVGARRTEPDRRADVDHREGDSTVEHAPRPLRPRLEIAAALTPDEEQEERDREEETDSQQASRDRQHRLEREDDHDERDQGDDREPSHGSVLEDASHDPVMVPRTPSAAATSAETANHSRRRAGIGRRIEPRREDDAERDRSVDVVELVGSPVVPGEQEQAERRLGDEQRLRKRQEMDRGAAQQGAAAVDDEAVAPASRQPAMTAYAR